MRANETMYANDGTQVCLFPMAEMIVTQESSPSSYSHCCGHPTDYGSNNVITDVYAPFDCHKVADYTTLGGSGHTVIYCSDSPVRTPSGDTYVTCQFTHDANPPLGDSYKQGQVIYHTGAYGWVTGIHLHLDQANVYNDSWVSYGYKCSGGTTNCWALKNSVQPNTIFYINDTTITNGGSFDWKKFEEEPSPTPTKKKMPLWMYCLNPIYKKY